MNEPSTILVAGYVGFGNLGDEGMLEGSITILRRVGWTGPICALSGNVEDTERRHGIAAVPLGNLAAVEAAVASAGLVLWGGGSLIHDVYGFRPRELFDATGHAPAVFLRIPLLARLLGVPCVAWGQGFAPLLRAESRRALASSLEACRAAIVRDPGSVNELARLGFRSPVVEIPDLAFALAPAAAGSEARSGRLAVAVRPWLGNESWEEALSDGLRRSASRRGISLRFVALQHEKDFAATDDLGLARRLAGSLREGGVSTEVVRPGTPAEAIEAFAGCDAVIAMRYHGVVFASLAGRPMATIAYDPKVRALPRELVPEDARLELQGLDPVLVAGAVDRMFEELPARTATVVRERDLLRQRLEDFAGGLAGLASLAGRDGAPDGGLSTVFSALLPARGSGGSATVRREELPTASFIETEIRDRLDAAIRSFSADRERLEQRLAEAAAERERTVTTLSFELSRRDQDRRRAEEARIASEAVAREERERAEREGAERRRVEERLAELSRNAAGEVARARGELATQGAEIEEWRRVAAETRKEVEDWKRAHDHLVGVNESLRADVEKWRRSRLGRLSTAWWRFRRWLRSRVRHLPGGSAGTPASVVEVAPRSPLSGGGSPEAGFPPVPSGHYDVIVLSIIDWDFRFQRPQQIATRYGRSGHRVLYLSTREFTPASGPAGQLVPKAANVAELQIRSRRALDIYAGRLESEDLDVLESAFGELAESLSIGDALVVVQIPFWAPLAERLRARFGWRYAYDCMDEWKNFPGFGENVLGLEEGLVERADLTVVSATKLEQKWRPRTSRLVVARNGIDLEHYRRFYRESSLLEDLRGPVVGYYGALASWVDVELIRRLAEARPGVGFVLAGGQFDVDLSPVAALPNVRLLGQRPYDEMPALLWRFDACLIPFLVNDITEATNPVKFYEYCFGGKPVVAPALTELLPFAESCYLARSREEFDRLLDEALREPADDPRREQRRRIAEENDWSRRLSVIDASARESWPLVSVVVVTHGGLELTRNCLESLLEGETWPRLEVIVVDNASPDRTRDYLDALAFRDPRMRAIYNGSNEGFAAANNSGIRSARGEIVVLLNNDTVVPPGLVGRLVAHLERDRAIGLLCPTTNFCGNEARVEPDYVDFADLPASAARRARRHQGQLFDIPVAAMYCVAARREVLDRVGALDEQFGLGMFEDDDFSIRVRREGFRVVCAEDAYVHHVGQGSFSRLSAREYNELWARNQAYFEKKWGMPWQPHKTRGKVPPATSRVG